MAKLEFPPRLRGLLEGSDLHAPLRAFADRVSEILADNKLTFFPDYTDHGIDHVNRVLQSEEELVPVEVWERSFRGIGPRPLDEVDAAVLIGATLLHDIAMHLTPAGFLELVSQSTRFQPLVWFKENQEGHPADKQWDRLWTDYVREARRFNDRTLANIVGHESVRNGWKFQELPSDVGQWERNHHLVIGEFLRRHHARLAHEIAIAGFPGVPIGPGEGQFPALGSEPGHVLYRLADLFGLSARSHGTSLRVCKAYLDASPLYPGTPRPMGAAVLYSMALLRVADYLQIDRQRAPAVLLQLRTPQSPVSIQEWKKHGAVQSISPATDPRGKTVTVSKNVNLSLFLQLEALVTGLQAEMDHSSAVLDEAYGSRSDLGLDQLRLATRRIYSNLYSPVFRDSLPFVPKRTGFSTDPNLLALLVEPLYGKYPSVAIRELIQNSVDAVRELHAWCQAHKVKVHSLDLPKQKSDVVVDFIKRLDGTWFVRVSDKGIGMASDTIQNYFLRAGASFRQSPEWAKEFLNETGQPRVPRAGRFGVGVFAIFLLGSTFRLSTRHITAKSPTGFAVEGTSDSDILEICRQEGLPMGTTIEVDISRESAELLALDQPAEKSSNLDRFTDWYSWDWPSVSRRVLHTKKPRSLESQYRLPIRASTAPPGWSLITPEGFDAVFWTYEAAPSLTCNGLAIVQPDRMKHEMIVRSASRFDWSLSPELERPNLAVIDSAANLPLTTQRYELSTGKLPFGDELERDVGLSVIAHALICGPPSREAAVSPSTSYRHPLCVPAVSQPDFSSPQNYRQLIEHGLLRWCVTHEQFVFADPWLYSLLRKEKCLVFGDLHAQRWRSPSGSYFFTDTVESDIVQVRWDAYIGDPYAGESQGYRDVHVVLLLLKEMARNGINVLGHVPEGALCLASIPRSMWAQYEERLRLYEELQYEEPHSDDLITVSETTYSRLIKHRSGNINPSLSPEQLESILTSDPEISSLNEGDLRNSIEPEGSMKWSLLRDRGAMYIMEIQTQKSDPPPTSLIARLWYECLGAVAIPFDKTERHRLIAHAREHPELRRHIEAWEHCSS